MTKTPATKHDVAIHEAGHAVAACVLGFPPSRVKLFYAGPDTVDAGVSWDQAAAGTDASLVFYYAGGAAELLAGATEPRGTTGDDECIEDIKRRLAVMSSEDVRGRLSSAKGRAFAILMKRWDAVEKIAARLELEGSMSMVDVVRAVDVGQPSPTMHNVIIPADRLERFGDTGLDYIEFDPDDQPPPSL